MYGPISPELNDRHSTVSLFIRTLRTLGALGGSLRGAVFTAALVCGTTAINADEPGEVEGLWATGGSLVEVSQKGETLQMIVVALEEPFDANGDPFLDTNNPDESMRTQPILGMNLLADYAFKSKRWQGKIYDPQSGSTYSSRMKEKDGKLEMRGYIGTPLFGKTKKFKPISVCREDMLVMLKNSNITGYCGL